MKRLTTFPLLIICMLVFLVVAVPAKKVKAATATPVPDCNTNTKFLGIIPAWYEYFGNDYGLVRSNNTFIQPVCGIVDNGNNDVGSRLSNHAVQIGLAVIDILLRVSALVAVAFIMMGGFKYMSSQGEPRNIEAAMATIVNAVIGLGIAVISAALVAYIGHKLSVG